MKTLYSQPGDTGLQSKAKRMISPLLGPREVGRRTPCRPQSAGSAGQSFAQRRPLAADPGPYAADHCNDRNEQDAQKHRVFDQSGAILVFAQAADESQSI